MPVNVKKFRDAAVQCLRAAAVTLACAGCTPQAMLASALVPEGTASILLSHLQNEEEGNRKLVAELESRKDWDGLARLAEENLKKDKNNLGWWMVSGYAHSQAGRHERAAVSYGEMVRLSPDDLLGWELLAQSYRAMGQSQRAVQTLNNALRVRTDAPAILLLLGQSHEDLRQDDQAVVAYRQLVKAEPGLAAGWLGYGRAHARLGRVAGYNEAMRELTRLGSPLAAELAKYKPVTR